MALTTEYIDSVRTVLPESMQHRVADCIKHGVGGVEVVEQHDEEAVVRQLVELCGLGLVVLQEHVGNCHQHLCGGSGGGGDCGSVRDEDKEIQYRE